MACDAHNQYIGCHAHNATISCHTHNAAIGCHTHNATIGCHTHVVTGVCDGHNATIACHSHDNSLVTAPNVPPCPSNVVTFSDPSLDPGVDKVRAADINELRFAIDAERSRRGLPTFFVGGEVSAGQVVDDANLITLRTALDSARPGLTWTQVVPGIENAGVKIRASRVEEVRANLNLSSVECACQCNYACTCNCNYQCTCNCYYSCTCNCNYQCTCNCNYGCTCNCNYSCTCNCNYTCTCNCYYSDKNLKKDIRFI